MPVNVGSTDRWLRAIAGIGLILLPLATSFGAGSTLLSWGSVIVGAVLLLTAMFKFCPIYRVLGLKTCRTK